MKMRAALPVAFALSAMPVFADGMPTNTPEAKVKVAYAIGDDGIGMDITHMVFDGTPLVYSESVIYTCNADKSQQYIAATAVTVTDEPGVTLDKQVSLIIDTRRKMVEILDGMMKTPQYAQEVAQGRASVTFTNYATRLSQKIEKEQEQPIMVLIDSLGMPLKIPGCGNVTTMAQYNLIYQMAKYNFAHPAHYL